MPMVEAMACELPVAAARGGAVPEIVKDGETGFLVDRGNASELAQAVLHLLGNEELRESMGRAGRQRVRELFSWNRTTDILLERYKSLLDE
jgi:spore coat protein SA